MHNHYVYVQMCAHNGVIMRYLLQFGGLLTPPVPRRSITPTANQERGWKYDRRQHRMWDEVERPRSSTPHKLLHTSLSSNMFYIYK